MQNAESFRISVGMPIFNAGQHLRSAVLSIIRQTFQDWELLIIDDGSTDGALESILDIVDDRIKVKRCKHNMGLAFRLNQAIDLACGEYFARMDQDDLSYPERFERQIQALDADPELDLVSVRAIMISKNNECIGGFPSKTNHAEICARPWQGFCFLHPTWMGRTSWFRKHHYIYPSPYLCEDQELLLRTYSSSEFRVIPEVLFAYRVPDKVKAFKRFKTQWSMLKIQLRQFRDKKKWIFCIFSVAVFEARVLIDIYKLFRQVVGVSFFKART